MVPLGAAYIECWADSSSPTVPACAVIFIHNTALGARTSQMSKREQLLPGLDCQGAKSLFLQLQGCEKLS